MNFKTYLVGGAVRDSLLNIQSNDLDYLVMAESFEELKIFLLKNGYKIWQEKPECLTIRAGKNGENSDFVLPRTEVYNEDSRQPITVVAETVEEDLSRRDFTINAIAQDTDTGMLIDPFGGQADLLTNKIIKCPLDTEKRLLEDPLRVLRAFRFAIRFGFDLDEELKNVIFVNNKELIKKFLKKVSSDRIREELLKSFKADSLKSISFIASLPIEWQEAIFQNNLWLLPTNKKKK
jgi:tRNA nucleotidyltransferase/poly(A) polymerase